MSEKWNYKLYLTGSDSPEKEAVRKAFEDKPTAEVYDVAGLEKNEFENEVINKALSSTKQVIAELGLRCQDINPENIHILSSDEFETKVDRESRGKTGFGHIYIIRDEDRPRFIHDLTHELSHLISFYALNVRHSYNEEDEKGQNEIGLRKSGFAFVPKVGQRDPYFNGLDEAVTEMFAQEIRKKFIESDPELTQETKDFLIKKVVYWPQIMVVDEIIQAVARNEEEYGQMIKELFTDRIAGESKVLKKISLHNKDWIKILYSMGSTNEDAEKAAFALGFSELAKKIEEYGIQAKESKGKD